MAFGGGLDAGRWLIEGRLTQGFTSFATDEAAASGEPSAPNRVFSILAGIRFQSPGTEISKRICPSVIYWGHGKTRTTQSRSRDDR